MRSASDEIMRSAWGPLRTLGSVRSHIPAACSAALRLPTDSSSAATMPESIRRCSPTTEAYGAAYLRGRGRVGVTG
jgi:hypothetical protein